MTVTVTLAPGIGRTARWVLLLSTVFGLAMMHTLGHAGMRMSPHTDDHQVMSPTGAAVFPVVVVAQVVGDTLEPDCAGDGCGGHGAMDGWSICLAILGGLAVFSLLALLLRTSRHRRRGPTAVGPAVGVNSRPPPGPSAGLAAASTAVLRI